MRSALGLCVLSLLGLHSSVFGQEVPPGVLIFCDDPSVDRAITSAVHKFNERLSTGHKLALFQILTASKSENGSDSLYSLQFTTRRSDCLATSNTLWTDCDYFLTGRKKPFSCTATILMTETEADTQQVHCKLDDVIVPERASCLGCPVDIAENSDELRVPFMSSINKYNTLSDSTHLFSLNDVDFATRQVVAGFRYKLRFDMRRTNCAKAEHKEIHKLCVHDEENVEFVNCNSTVDVAPWRHEVPQANVNCEAGPLPPTTFTRRRPPGWSPLRNLLFDSPSSTSSPPPSPSPPSQSPSKASAKEESSEEDTTASKPPASPDAASNAGTANPVNDNPFHCPSKPWKAFNPAMRALPTKATTEVASPQPAADGVLSDKDLLG